MINWIHNIYYQILSPVAQDWMTEFCILNWLEKKCDWLIKNWMIDCSFTNLACFSKKAWVREGEGIFGGLAGNGGNSSVTIFVNIWKKTNIVSQLKKLSVLILLFSKQKTRKSPLA